MIKKYYKRFFLIGILFLLIFITSCSCSNNGYKTKFAEDAATASEDENLNLIKWVNKKLNDAVSAEIEAKKEATGSEVELTEAEKLQIKKDAAIKLIEDYTNYDVVTNGGKQKYQYREVIIKCDVEDYKKLIDKAQKSVDTDESPDGKWVKAATFVRSCTDASNGDANSLIKDTEKYLENLDEKTDEELKDLNLNDIVCAFGLKVEDRTQNQETEPIVFHGKTAGDFFSHLFNNLLVFPIAWLIVHLSKLFGGLYIIGLILATILVRTIAWPIYAKTNDMSLKMQLMQPELSKIQEKYGNKQDERSKQMQQMEMARLYKKYKIGLGGCLMPIIQFPIFMAIFRAISRIPYTIAYEGTIYQNNWANEINSKLFNFDLFEDRTAGTGQLIGIIILMIIVVGTQFLSQWLSQRRQKKTQQESQADIPAYRRQAYEQTKNSSQSTMKIMMYMMILMMGLFVFTSKAGLGVYWCIGNLYSMAQMYINSKTSANRLEKIKKKL